MAEKMTNINPQMLVWAREVSCTTIKEAEEKFGKERIYNWEHGIDFPTYNQLKSLCKFYRKPIAVCFFPEPPELKNIPASCRTLPNSMHFIFNRDFTKYLDEARVMQINLKELNNDENPNYHNFRQSKLETFDIVEAANRLRFIFNVSAQKQKSIKKIDERFEYWRSLFNNIGIYVFKAAFGLEDISGFCIYDNNFPIIYVNNSLSFTRQIFTLFHELYHIIVQTSGIDFLNDTDLYHNLNDVNVHIEKICNEFAGAFLVPDSDFDKELQNRELNENRISRLAQLYGVSREVILRKLLDRNCINQDEYERLRNQYIEDYFRNKNNKEPDKKGGGSYYNTQVSYKGSKYIELVLKNYYSNKITITQVSDYMNMKIPNIQKLVSKKGWGVL